jgi:hypothetical protein
MHAKRIQYPEAPQILQIHTGGDSGIRASELGRQNQKAAREPADAAPEQKTTYLLSRFFLIIELRHERLCFLIVAADRRMIMLRAVRLPFHSPGTTIFMGWLFGKPPSRPEAASAVLLDFSHCLLQSNNHLKGYMLHCSKTSRPST